VSGICGFVGRAPEGTLERMLEAIAYRGDASDSATVQGAAFGYRFWTGRAHKASGVLRDGHSLLTCAGTLAPPVAMPATWLRDRLTAGAAGLGDVDGAFAFAHWSAETRTLTLGRDPFGVRSLYYAEHGGTFYFATELKQLLAIPELPVELDPLAIHKYLTFSFVPGEAVPIRGIRRLLPGHLLTLKEGKPTTERYFTLVEQLDPELSERKAAVRRVRQLLGEATAKRLHGESEVGLFLSGGLDSSSVAVFLRDGGVAVHAFSLDFGAESVEREQAQRVAQELGLRQTLVPVNAARIASVFDEVVHKLDLPFGDPVTAPQYLLGQAAREAGLSAVFNGEGGDQLFGGWTSKPMIAAEVYGNLYESQDETREETYLRSYHRFYGLEEELYSADFKQRVGQPGQRRAHLAPYLHAEGQSFLNQVRLADISLKGSQSILPRAERMTGCFGLDLRAPLFDRALAETSFRLPPELKLHGATEKYVLKVAMKRRLPDDIVWRKKYGMSVPITDFVFAPALAPKIEDLLGEPSLRSRGLFKPEFVARLRAGLDVPGETRRRRIGERLWALAMLEAWLRRFLDQRGRA
jgi:asparagine synthase (glutamine-hydrolysing)